MPSVVTTKVSTHQIKAQAQGEGKKDVFHVINTVVLTLFIVLMPFVQQKFNPTVLPLALNLLTCSVGHLIIYSRQKK